MKTTLPILAPTLALALALAVSSAVRADETAAKLTAANALVDKTVLKTLDTGFNVSLEKTVAAMPEEKAETVRKEARAEFDKQRQIMLEGLSKVYAEKFSLDELKHIQGIYDDKTYQKFQAINADPKSEINLISQAGVTKLLNMLAIAAAAEKQGGMPGDPTKKPMQMPAEGR